MQSQQVATKRRDIDLQTKGAQSLARHRLANSWGERSWRRHILTTIERASLPVSDDIASRFGARRSIGFSRT